MKKINNRKSLEGGFTLIELLVVIAIIGLLSSIVLASLNTARQKAIDAKIASERRQLQTAMELYYNDNSAYPRPVTGGYTSGSFRLYCIGGNTCLLNETGITYPLSSYSPNFTYSPSVGGLSASNQGFIYAVPTSGTGATKIISTRRASNGLIDVIEQVTGVWTINIVSNGS